ncbi:hypothetical protein BC628DRAFT_1357367 [Trametes gibbosa]|nr:hypothetical protein BC628DRAFT_1357367 [Trametes gibbosa]
MASRLLLPQVSSFQVLHNSEVAEHQSHAHAWRLSARQVVQASRPRQFQLRPTHNQAACGAPAPTARAERPHAWGWTEYLMTDAPPPCARTNQPQGSNRLPTHLCPSPCPSPTQRGYSTWAQSAAGRRAGPVGRQQGSPRSQGYEGRHGRDDALARRRPCAWRVLRSGKTCTVAGA